VSHPEIIREALTKRESLAADPGTTAYRIFDCIGDRIPGLVIDNFDGHWLAQGTEPEPPKSLRNLGLSRSLWWKRLDQQEKESPRLIEGDAPAMPFEVRENGMTFLIDFTAGYSQGIFLDQRQNRARVRDATRTGDAVLNCFAYTCGFSLAAAVAGATTTSVDLSGNYLDWGRRIFQANSIDSGGHYFSKGDVFEWLAMFAKKGRQFQGIVLDPPTFSRSKSKKGKTKGGVFRVEDDYGELVAAARAVLAPGGWMLCCANTHRLDPYEFEQVVADAAQLDAQTLPMPPEFTGDGYLKSVWIG
jgi:23S rRNA (cytosine1962-C5)-methyltransferase